MSLNQSKQQEFMQPMTILKGAVAVEQAKTISPPQKRWRSQFFSRKSVTILIKD
ncbi:MAG: hypothetical protein KME49_30325 [Brasilonema octagenarum HA4186-MV1]|jgi:hypothetical protein|uniref:hypothetical protein n=1 Tax=Brasilonema octagenarum TaxID=417105 RepID=UPI00145D5A46|nr:hypothetical protein [Brasilonema octagenarum]MBW4629692.1 hypothetical protein [Brasilonema octagenarum HA4186-MV1]